MSMLAEPRKRQRISVNPDGVAWSSDSSKFGQKLMEQMGWQQGKGLGSSEDGTVSHVKVKMNMDGRGLGCSKKDADNWLAHQDDFDALLAQLSSTAQDAAAAVCADEGGEPRPCAASGGLVEKSKSSRKRVHYEKFTKGKDLSLYDQKHLAQIFGRRREAATSSASLRGDGSASVTSAGGGSSLASSLQPDEPEASSTSKGVIRCAETLIDSALSVADYFARKMAAKRARETGNSTGGDGGAPHATALPLTDVGATDESLAAESQADSGAAARKKKRRKGGHVEVACAVAAEAAMPPQPQLPAAMVAESPDDFLGSSSRRRKKRKSEHSSGDTSFGGVSIELLVFSGPAPTAAAAATDSSLDRAPSEPEDEADGDTPPASSSASAAASSESPFERARERREATRGGASCSGGGQGRSSTEGRSSKRARDARAAGAAAAHDRHRSAHEVASRKWPDVASADRDASRLKEKKKRRKPEAAVGGDASDSVVDPVGIPQPPLGCSGGEESPLAGDSSSPAEKAIVKGGRQRKHDRRGRASPTAVPVAAAAVGHPSEDGEEPRKMEAAGIEKQQQQQPRGRADAEVKGRRAEKATRSQSRAAGAAGRGDVMRTDGGASDCRGGDDDGGCSSSSSERGFDAQSMQLPSKLRRLVERAKKRAAKAMSHFASSSEPHRRQSGQRPAPGGGSGSGARAVTAASRGAARVAAARPAAAGSRLGSGLAKPNFFVGSNIHCLRGYTGYPASVPMARQLSHRP